MRRRVGQAAACLLLCLCTTVPAAAQGARDRTWHGTVYLGHWVSMGGTEDAQFASVLVNRVLVPQLRTGWALLDGSSIEVEGQIGRHFGDQRHGEATLALMWRSRDVTLPWTDTRMNFAAAEGFSYALSRPTLEGVVNDQEPRKFLNYLAFELELSHPSLPDVSLVPRLHHRSGIFGLIAPQGSGSDFLGIGLRMTLR
jgi:hypothetical protein